MVDHAGTIAVRRANAETALHARPGESPGDRMVGGGVPGGRPQPVESNHRATVRRVNEYWLWTDRAGWVLHVRPYSRAELDAIEPRWSGVAGEEHGR